MGRPPKEVKKRHPALLFSVFAALSIIDIGFNAAAGAAAVSTGALASGLPLTERAIGIGALAGITKAGLVAFFAFMKVATQDLAVYTLLSLLGTGFGIAIVVTVQVSNAVLGDAPPELLIAAIVAAIPTLGEFSSVYQPLETYYESEDDGRVQTIKIGFPKDPLKIGLDALGGYVFARMAQNKGES
ncbi:hypothetical protein VTJ49DRAFT_6611 [Mycothermus thermophilus]|uniref:Uncharacterized protein n=1 Tax=Humicola insolens TaxID=85995 RepID=A0ABR3VK82_HUMIN